MSIGRYLKRLNSRMEPDPNGGLTYWKDAQDTIDGLVHRIRVLEGNLDQQQKDRLDDKRDD